MIDFSDIIIGTAHAQALGEQSQGGFGSIVPLIVIFFIFYFLLIRPQQKKIKEHQSMVGSLKKGDKVVTAGGIIGTIAKVNDEGETVDVKISSSVEVTILRSTIADITTKTIASSGSTKKTAKTTKKKPATKKKGK